MGSEQTIVEVSAETPVIDVTSSRQQTTVSKDEIDYAPRGRSFQSAIAFAPGARLEPLQGGFQIDGGATAENSYLINGMETGSMVTGKSAANAPFEFVQEVQVKTGGIEAENGGALGGVVNVIGKRGSNTWHGNVWTYYEGDPMDSSYTITPLSQMTRERRTRAISFAPIRREHTRHQTGRTMRPSFIHLRRITSAIFSPASTRVGI